MNIGPYTSGEVDPSAQDLDQIGIAPGAERRVTLAAPFRALESEQQATRLDDNVLGFTLAMPATTQAVRLGLVNGECDSPSLYRNVFDPIDTGSLGLPLAGAGSTLV